tara:strand:- start:590 stop:772 length:183 start_codon:yes stop_codon:yes gene_type:complete
MIKGHFKYWTEQDYINEVIKLHKKQEKKKNENIREGKIYRNKIQTYSYQEIERGKNSLCY